MIRGHVCGCWECGGSAPEATSDLSFQNLENVVIVNGLFILTFWEEVFCFSIFQSVHEMENISSGEIICQNLSNCPFPHPLSQWSLNIIIVLLTPFDRCRNKALGRLNNLPMATRPWVVHPDQEPKSLTYSPEGLCLLPSCVMQHRLCYVYVLTLNKALDLEELPRSPSPSLDFT